jgi:hypothetical protein
MIVTGQAPKEPVRFIATIPAGSDFSDDLSAALSSMGYATLDRKTSGQLFYRLGLGKDIDPDPKTLAKLKKRKVDLVMNVQAKIAEPAFVRGRPENAQVSVRATGDGQSVANLDWANAWGGMRGSPADSTMMQTAAAAARNIANALAPYLGRPAAREPFSMDDLPNTPVAIMLQDGAPAPAAAEVPQAPSGQTPVQAAVLEPAAAAPAEPVKRGLSADEKSRLEYDIKMLVP